MNTSPTPGSRVPRSILGSVWTRGLALCLCLAPLAQASVTMKNFSTAPFNCVNGVSSFSGTVTDPAYNGGATAATFTFANPLKNVEITVPSAPDFSTATTSYIGYQSQGFGVGDANLGRFDRKESITMSASHPFQLNTIQWGEWHGDEVIHISWISGGVPQELVFNTTASTSNFGALIKADANTLVIFTNVGPSTATAYGRLRFQQINVSLIDPLVEIDGALIPIASWSTYPWSLVSGQTSFSSTYNLPENGGTAATFTFADAKKSVNITDPNAPDATAATASYFGRETKGWGVGDSGLGRFDRGESFTFTSTHKVRLHMVKWDEYHGDEVLHLKWTHNGVLKQQLFNTNKSLYTFSGVVMDANSTMTVTNVSPSSATAYGRLRFEHMFLVPVFNAEPTYASSGPDGFVRMYGVNLSGGEYGTTGTYGYTYIYPSAAQMDYYHAKGQNLIRLPFRWERVQPTLNGALSTSEMNRIDTVIGYAAARGMKVVLDMHNYARRGGNIIGSTALPNSAFADVWRRIADRYKTSTAIYGYGIMNEPHGTGGLWPAAAQAATTAIREVDTANWVIVAGDNWSSARSWRSSNPNLNVSDPSGKLMYEAHCYFANANNDMYESYDAENAYPEKGALLVTNFINWLSERGARGFIGEYGVPGNDPRWNTVLDKFMSHLSAHSVSGTYWAGGLWWGSYELSVEPTGNFTVDKPQMSILELYQ